MGFKEMLERDMRTVFHNANEFADMRRIFYNGEDYGCLPVILDAGEQKERSTKESDHGMGIYEVDAVLFINFIDMPCVPEQGQRIWVDDMEYRIETSACDLGQIKLGLRRYDE